MTKHRKQPVQTDPLANFQAAKTDPQGSWTGVPADPDEVPVQDADFPEGGDETPWRCALSPEARAYNQRPGTPKAMHWRGKVRFCSRRSVRCVRSSGTPVPSSLRQT